MSFNSINAWRQGSFVDQSKYNSWDDDMKKKGAQQEEHLVRPSILGGSICYCSDPNDAKWIASRLNLASDLERLTYEFAVGREDEKKLIEYVFNKIEG